jgi:hypothetical protein
VVIIAKYCYDTTQNLKGFAEIRWRPLSHDALYTSFASLVAAQQILSWLSSTVEE